MGEKRGLSHIEFVIAFVIFAGFLVFAFMFFSPLQSNRTIKSTLDYAWIEISRNTSSEVETYSVVMKEDNPPALVAILIDGVNSNYNAVVENINGNILPSFKDTSGIKFNRQGNNFVRIRYSPNFVNGASTPGTFTQITEIIDYNISSSDTGKFYFESLFLELNRTYFSDYAGLKRDINLPNRMEFGFVANLNDVEIRAVKNNSEESEVLSKNDRIEALRQNGTRQYADLTVLVW